MERNVLMSCSTTRRNFFMEVVFSHLMSWLDKNYIMVRDNTDWRFLVLVTWGWPTVCVIPAQKNGRLAVNFSTSWNLFTTCRRNTFFHDQILQADDFRHYLAVGTVKIDNITSKTAWELSFQYFNQVLTRLEMPTHVTEELI